MTIIQKGEPMTDLIDRQAAIDATSEIVFVEYEDDDSRKEESIILQTKAAIRDGIKALPPVYVPDTNVGDMISRQAAIEMLMNQNVIMEGSEYHNGFNAGVNRAQEVIRNLPPVQPKRGKWIEMPYIPSHTKYMCSECGKTIYTNSEYLKEHKFCFSCGARMVEPQESEDKTK